MKQENHLIFVYIHRKIVVKLEKMLLSASNLPYLNKNISFWDKKQRATGFFSRKAFFVVAGNAAFRYRHHEM